MIYYKIENELGIKQEFEPKQSVYTNTRQQV